MRHSRGLALIIAILALAACVDGSREGPTAPSFPAYSSTDTTSTSDDSGYTVGGNSTESTDTTTTDRSGYTVGGN